MLPASNGEKTIVVSPFLSRADVDQALQQGLLVALKEISDTVRAELRIELRQAVSDIREMCSKGQPQQVASLSQKSLAEEALQTLSARNRAKTISDVVATSLREWSGQDGGNSARSIQQGAAGNEYVRLDLVDACEAEAPTERCRTGSAAAAQALKRFEISEGNVGHMGSGPFQDFVKSKIFEWIIGVLVLLNTLLVGFETNLAAHNDGVLPEPWRDLFAWFESLFCILFAAEWILRVFFFRCDFFCGEECMRNIFDSVIIGLQVLDQMMTIFKVAETEWIRLIRVLRILRITRLLYLYKNLKFMAFSIIESLESLIPTITLLVMLIYTASVLLKQILMQWSKNTHEMTYWFGDLPRTALTLLETIAGGVSWDEPCAAIFHDSGAVAGLFFLLYVCFGVFVILNVIMGVFIDKAIKVAEGQRQLDVACAITEAFMNDEDRHGEEVTREVFDEKLREPDLQACFETLNIDMSQAHLLFDLIDVDSSGRVDGREIVEGCLRLKGIAKALDLSIMERALHGLVEKVDCNISVAEEHMTSVEKHLLEQMKNLEQLNRNSVQG